MKTLFEAQRILGYNIYVPHTTIFSLNPGEGWVCISSYFNCFHWNFPNTAWNTHSLTWNWNWIIIIIIRRKIIRISPSSCNVASLWVGLQVQQESSSLGMKAIYLIERSGISRSFKWIFHISKQGNDRKCQVTSTPHVTSVGRQRPGCLIAGHLTL